MPSLLPVNPPATRDPVSTYPQYPQKPHACITDPASSQVAQDNKYTILEPHANLTRKTNNLDHRTSHFPPHTRRRFPKDCSDPGEYFERIALYPIYCDTVCPTHVKCLLSIHRRHVPRIRVRSVLLLPRLLVSYKTTCPGLSRWVWMKCECVELD
ncbi:uncharacterized protein K460DRAFT_126243 [Cucurbitaria berberidis CBS 394.84]|uniref:Uncharacterized protein n=1 Tax=Cucurbitaria berberidis CBS 394.84 TaxID=1168544 RepID=A0A9P4GJX3_9PLEO|nr:uncharacterized protein K460DRAFT_126243 [Cucurbitaria berberidis CBS 394.84]KAF1846564.1 hypothetical protein K460DRAFT_126243 [Cucurbitaria berberidis CBS 394.84]